MKKIMFFVCLFFIGSMVYAEKFTIGDYIEGEYVRMVGKDKTKNLNVQKIVDSNGKFVYCLEPFILVDEKKEDYKPFSCVNGYSLFCVILLRCNNTGEDF